MRGGDMDETSVRLDVEADNRDLAILRSVAAAMAARADLTLEQLDDARLAVDEAAAYLISRCSPGDRVFVDFTSRDGELHVKVSSPAHGSHDVARNTFGWTVLSALATHADASVSDSFATITMSFVRHAPVEA